MADKEGLQTLLQVILASGQARVHEIEVEARAEIEAMLAEARSSEKRIHEEALKQAERRAEQERIRNLQEAELEAIHLIAKANEAVVGQAMEEVCEQLKALRHSPTYPDVLDQLIRETITSLERSLTSSERCVLHADPRDRDIIEDEQLAVDLEYDLKCWGGVVGQSPDRHITVTNTLESRFERAKPHLRQQLATAFADAQPERVK